MTYNSSLTYKMVLVQSIQNDKNGTFSKAQSLITKLVGIMNNLERRDKYNVKR